MSPATSNPTKNLGKAWEEAGSKYCSSSTDVKVKKMRHKQGGIRAQNETMKQSPGSIVLLWARHLKRLSYASSATKLQLCCQRQMFHVLIERRPKRLHFYQKSTLPFGFLLPVIHHTFNSILLSIFFFDWFLLPRCLNRCKHLSNLSFSMICNSTSYAMSYL